LYGASCLCGPRVQDKGLRLVLDAKQGVRVRTHAAPPLFLYLLAVSTTPGRHSEALTSCYSPLSGSCSLIHSGYCDQRTSRRRRSAPSSLRRSRSRSQWRSLIRSCLCFFSVARRSSVIASAGASTRSFSPSVSSKISCWRSSDSRVRTLTGRASHARRKQGEGGAYPLDFSCNRAIPQRFDLG